MKYGLMLLMLAVVACQQPTSAPLNESDIFFKKNSSATQMMSESTGTGIVTWTNKPGNAGKITTASGSVFTYNVSAGHTVNGYQPVVGDAVEFNTGTGQSARAVRPYTIPDDGGDDDEGGEDDDEDEVTPPPPPPPPLW